MTPPSVPLFEVEPVLNRSGQIEELARNTVSMVCLDLRKRELELFEALDAEDLPAAREAAHSIRGLAGLAGFTRLEVEASDWEECLAGGSTVSGEEAHEAFRRLLEDSIRVGMEFAKDT